MLYALGMTVFVFFALIMAALVFLQQGKGDMGLGSIGSAQMLFGGSGGQTLVEKVTWALVALFMVGSLGLSVLKKYEGNKTRLSSKIAAAQK